MSTVQAKQGKGEAAPDVAYLVMSAPDDFVHDRFAGALIAAGAQLQRYGTGLKMPCRGVDWKSILQAAGTSLSITERHDIRIATVLAGKGPAALATAMFGARRLDERLHELSAEWLPGVLRRGAIAIHFQPLIQQPPGRLHGYECLMRGVDDAGAFIPPAKMFEAATHLGLLSSLDEKCRLTAIARAARLGIGSQLFLNFHSCAIYNPKTCLRNTIAAIKSAGIGHGQVTFEGSASLNGADRNHLADILRYCQSLGFKIALDHVGAEFASAQASVDLRPDYIKFDGAFIRRAAESSSSGQIVRDMAEAARQQGIMTVAGGIETEREMKCAFDAGFRLSQGFFHARPAEEALGPDGLKETLRRVKDAWAMGKEKASGESTKAWDISGLYRNLATLADAPQKSA